jgi:molybdopterin-guanine dinucleotide biosynthesis protein A
MEVVEASGIILAGGESRRMGRDKAWIEFDGKPLIERVADALERLTSELIVVTNNPKPYERLDARLVSDMLPGNGSLGGIYSGLHAARFKYSLVVACDMPFLNPALLKYLLSLAAKYDVVIPSAPDPSKPKKEKSTKPTAKDADLHPLHAVYSKKCLTPIESALQNGDRRMISFHPAVRVRIVTQIEIEQFDPNHLSLFNANTPEELARAQTIIRA